jgi:protein-L-isoaspartate(D-aspartate) O-methyltransferase
MSFDTSTVPDTAPLPHQHCEFAHARTVLMAVTAATDALGLRHRFDEVSGALEARIWDPEHGGLTVIVRDGAAPARERCESGLELLVRVDGGRAELSAGSGRRSFGRLSDDDAAGAARQIRSLMGESDHCPGTANHQRRQEKHMTRVVDTADKAAALRAAMVEELRGLGAFSSEAVEAAVSTVPRHLFAPGEILEVAYAADSPIMTKRDEAGAALSSVSATHLQVVMLEQAELRPGMRVLEIGSGGYNAALIQELVGADGLVVSVDIDPEIVERARTCLAAAGYRQVGVTLADADDGVPEHAPFDRIIVTAGAWDIPPAWLDQLTGGGRIVVPLRMKGLTRSIAFDWDGESLASRSYGLCRFVPMQGSGSHRKRFVTIDDGVLLQVDDPAQTFDIQALRQAVHSPAVERWSGAAYDLPDELELFLVTSGPGISLLHVDQPLIEQGRFAPSAARGVPALISGGSIAYRTRRPNDESDGFESGVIAHGPDAASLADRYVDLLRRWATDHRRRGAAQIKYFPKAVSAADPSQYLMVKQHGAIEISWA